MIISNPQGVKVLIATSGDITLVTDTAPRHGLAFRHLRRHYPTIAASALGVTVVSTIITVTAATMLLGRSEARLESRIKHLANHLQTVMAAVDMQSERQSFRVMEHVEQISDKVEKVGDDASAVAGHVDLLPATIGRAAQDSAQSAIGWLAALKPPAESPAPQPRPGPMKQKKSAAN